MGVREEKFPPIKEQSGKATSSTKTLPLPLAGKELFSPPKALVPFLYHPEGNYYFVSFFPLGNIGHVHDFGYL